MENFKNGCTKPQLVDFLHNVAINLDAKGGQSPLPCAAWVEDLDLTPLEVSNWLADSFANPNDPLAIYAGMGPDGNWYICAGSED